MRVSNDRIVWFVGYNGNCIVLMETVMDPVGLHC